MDKKYLHILKNNHFARNSLVLFVMTMAVNILNYLFHLLVGRMVSARAYGEIESLVSLMNIAAVFTVALGMIAAKRNADFKAEKNGPEGSRFFWKLSGKTFSLTAPFLILGMILIPWLKNFLKIESFWPFIGVLAAMLFSLLYSVSNGALTGWQEFSKSGLSGIWGTLIKLAAGVFLVKIGFEVGGPIAGFVLGGAVSYVVSVVFLKKIFASRENVFQEEEKTRKSETISWKKYVLPVFLGNLGLAVFSNLDMFLAKHSLNPDLAGQYGALSIISKAIFFATGVIGTVLFSMSSEKKHLGESSSGIFKNALIFTSAICFLAILLYGFFPKFILGLLFGEKYLAVSGQLILFAVSASVLSFLNLIFQYLMSKQKTTVAYWLFATALIFWGAIAVYGDNISAIIKTAVLVQTLALAGGAIFCFKHGSWKREKTN